MANWKQIKFQYEVLGEDTRSLAEQHRVSSLLLENTINSEEWERRPITKAIQEWSQSDKPEEIMVDIQNKATLLNTLRTSELGPNYYKAEAALLSKLTDAINMVGAKDEGVAKTLKALTECLVTLRPVTAEEASPTAGVTINIATGWDNTPSREIN